MTTSRRRNTPGCEYIEHTADIGLRCSAATPEQLFERAAAGMFGLIGTLRPGARRQDESVSEQRIVLRAANQEELLVSWLAELLSIADAQTLMLRSARFARLNETALDAVAAFIPRAGHRFDYYCDIKAVTYHKLRIISRGDTVQAEVFFDV